MNIATEKIKKYKPYPEYKDSGVEWLGKVPEHWEVKKLKYLVKEKLKYGANESAELDDPSLPRYIRITDFGDDGKLRDDTFKSLPQDKAKEYLLGEGDILFARSGATVGKTFQFKSYDGIACFAGYLIKASPDKDKILSDFEYYYTKSNAYDNWKNSIFIQATIQNIGADKYQTLLVTQPSLNEQTEITDYLDEKTTRIDDLIAKKERVIELLREKRTALISHAVTKGLNPDVKMKASGVEWLERNYKFAAGDRFVPWLKSCSISDEFKPLKYLCDVNANVLPENTSPDTEIIYIDISNVDSNGKVINQEEINFDSAPSRARRILSDGDVFLSTVRTYLRAISYVEKAEHNLICSTGFAVISSGYGVYPKFLFYWVRSSLFVVEVVARSVGVSYPAINALEVGNLPFPMIDINEQQAIADFLDRETSRIDALIAKVTEAIEKLKEYRTALISAAVTGKIDVRKEQDT